jgi:hypothetical protein
MENIKSWILLGLLWMLSSPCLSADWINVILLPDSFDSFDCHQPGVEFKVADRSSVGILGRFDCDTDRATYGSSNDSVSNTFSRVLIPWRYSRKGTFKDGTLIEVLVGAERSKFRSDLGSMADVTFMDLGLYYGYQWFWDSGFNISAMAGVAYLVETSSSKEIAQNETSDVIDYLNKNTETNVHGGLGIIIGWTF